MLEGMWGKVISTVAVVVVLSAGCGLGSEPVSSGSGDLPPHPVAPAPTRALAPRHDDPPVMEKPKSSPTRPFGRFSDAARCGSFAVVSEIASVPSVPRFGVPGTTRPEPDYIGAADALDNARVDGASPVLESTINAYVHAVRNLGVAINRHEKNEHVAALRDLVDVTGRAVSVSCGESS